MGTKRSVAWESVGARADMASSYVPSHALRSVDAIHESVHAAVNAVAVFDWSYANVRDVMLAVPVWPYLLVPHCVAACLAYYAIHMGRDAPLKSLVLSFLAAFAGSHATALLTGTTIPLLTPMGDTLVATLFVAWFTIRYVAPVRRVFSFSVVRAPLMAAAVYVKMLNITIATESLVSKHSPSMAGPVVLGGLVGSGGALALDFEKSVAQQASMSNLSSPSWAFSSAYMASALMLLLPMFDAWLRDTLRCPSEACIVLAVQPSTTDYKFWIASAFALDAFLFELFGVSVASALLFPFRLVVQYGAGKPEGRVQPPSSAVAGGANKKTKTG
ncbi:hypothetical protein FVE85_7648 [Porphyridium purpureum]|uniref:Transmembrane protein n=1 Tax=Porphyridium purpureum TaxID=35688 RepID=A0A5J4ZBC7_PORPP|nr:hypothetical protein FVE85_7648 [Porphyridium purpureum]|eukprot:POR1608..scf295_1